MKDTIENSKQLSIENKKFYTILTEGILDLLNKDNLSEEERKDLRDLLKLVAEKMDELDTKDKHFLIEALNGLWDYAGKALMIFASIFGVKVVYQMIKDRFDS